MRLLLAEDQPELADHLIEGLRAEGYAVDVANDGDEALWLAHQGSYDALLMDVMLPAWDGITERLLCPSTNTLRRTRAHCSMSIYTHLS